MPENFFETDAAGSQTERNASINLLDASAERASQSDRLIPTARFVGLAGAVGGVTELTFNRLNMSAVRSLEQASAELAVNAAQAKVHYNAVDTLAKYRPAMGQLRLEVALSDATVDQVNRVWGAADSAGRVGRVNDFRTLNGAAQELNMAMRAEMRLVNNSAGHAFLRGFGKGVAGMSIGIGAGYVIDQLTESEEMRLNSPAGLILDGAAGVALLSNLPGRVKYPLALAAIAVPRICQANGLNLGLGPATFSGESMLRPNAVDAIGIGLAAGLPVDGRIKLAIGAAAIVGGRMYNAVNTERRGLLS